MARGDIRKAAIRKIAEGRRVGIGIAAHIYDCMSIKQKKVLTQRIEAQQRKEPPHDP